MAIRIFACTWTTRQEDGMTHVYNPIQAYFEENSVAPDRITIGTLWPDRDPDTHLPVFSYCLVNVRSPDIPGSTLEQLDNLGGVTMIPAYRLTKPWDEIPQAVRDAIATRLGNLGAPSTIWTNNTIYRDFLIKLGKWVRSIFDIANYDAIPETEFD